jgi:hypothetical protein
MSFDNPRCKAHCEKIEFCLWAVLLLAVGILWGFSIYKFVEAL